MKKYKPFFEKVTSNLLYHFTDLKGLFGIVKDNYKLTSKGRRTISFTRKFNLEGTVFRNAEIRLVINKSKLSKKYRITPYHDIIGTSSSSRHFPKRDEAEERVVLDKFGDKVDIKDSIIQIDMSIGMTDPWEYEELFKLINNKVKINFEIPKDYNYLNDEEKEEMEEILSKYKNIKVTNKNIFRIPGDRI